MFDYIASLIVFNLFGIAKNSQLGNTLHFFIYDVMKILFLLFTIIALISLLRSYIDNNKFKKFIEKQPKAMAHIMASIFGAITPFCSCSSIPLFIGFLESGLPFGVAMSFLITSPMINEIAVVLLAGVVGLKVTVIYIITGIVVGAVGGYLLEKFGFEKYLQDYIFKLKNSNCGCCCQKEKETFKQRVKSSLIYAKDLFKKIFLYVFIGVGVGAVLHGYVPQEFFLKYMSDDNLFAVPMAVLCGIPLYADVTSIVPIAQVLIEKGSAIGTVLIFMMSTVALSLPEMIILTRVMKKELIIRYTIFMAIVFMLIGYFYNFIF